DVAVMSRELLKHPLITQYTTIWMDTIRGGASQLVNTNKLVRFYPGATGLKTGTTAAAGSCLSASASRDGLSLIAVVLGASTSDDRFSTCRKLLDYGFANYTVYTPTWNDSLMQPIPVQHGLLDSVPLLAPDTDGLLVPKADVSRVMVTVDRQALLTAPILSGQQVGRVVVSLDGTEIASYPLRAAFEVPRLTFGRAFAWLWAAVMG
ncbi:MAG: D-alanyl-D-alanine carboxypeptidase, partial [Oscillospiraceae bacterium]|nr:D-alanyl-D-alanine carboxypeptidase [Oscillospiraceae bacterium]